MDLKQVMKTHHSNMKLYEISLGLQQLWEDLQNKIYLLEDLNLSPEEYKKQEEHLYKEHEKALLSLEGTHADKCLDVASYVKNLTAEEEAISAEEVKLRARRKRCERTVEFYKMYLRSHMEPGHNIKNGHVVIGWRKSSAVVVNCKAEDLPKEFQRTTIFIEPKRDSIKEAILAGDETLLGKATIEERYNIQIK